MKKYLVYLLTAVLVVSMSACGSKKTDDSAETKSIKIESVVEETSSSVSEEAESEEEKIEETVSESVEAEAEAVSEEAEEEEPTEGAPVAGDRKIDEEPISTFDVAGLYNGIYYKECSLSMYTSFDDDSAMVGVMELIDENDAVVYSGEIICVMDNFYELYGEDVNFTVYTEDGNFGLDLYVNGEHVDYMTLVEHFVS